MINFQPVFRTAFYSRLALVNVEKLEILAVEKLKKGDQGDFLAEVSWTVGGSVSHFEHTHYQRNFNHAIITFGIGDDFWKIEKIELLDERRLI